MHFLYGTPVSFILLLSTCQARRELPLFRVDDVDPSAVQTTERRAEHATQAAMFGDESSSAPKKTVERKAQHDHRETYRSEEARLQKERREMFFRNLGVGFGGRNAGTSMSMGTDDDPISAGLMSLSFSMDIVSEIEFGSLDDFTSSSGSTTAGSADDLGSGDVGTSTTAIQSTEQAAGSPRVDVPLAASEPQISTWQEVKAKLLGTRIDVLALRAKALAYAEKQRSDEPQLTGTDANLRSVAKTMPWDDPDRPYDELKAKALMHAAEVKNQLSTEHHSVQVRRRMLEDGSQQHPPSI